MRIGECEVRIYSSIPVLRDTLPQAQYIQLHKSFNAVYLRYADVATFTNNLGTVLYCIIFAYTVAIMQVKQVTIETEFFVDIAAHTKVATPAFFVGYSRINFK